MSKIVIISLIGNTLLLQYLSDQRDAEYREEGGDEDALYHDGLVLAVLEAEHCPVCADWHGREDGVDAEDVTAEADETGEIVDDYRQDQQAENRYAPHQFPGENPPQVHLGHGCADYQQGGRDGDVSEQGYRSCYQVWQSLDVEHHYQRGQVAGYHGRAHEYFPVQFQTSRTSLYHLFPERECQKGERDVQQARIEDGVFAENRGDYRVANEADIAESQHESVDALHVLVFRYDARKEHCHGHEKCVCHAAYGKYRQNQSLVRRDVTHYRGDYQARAADIYHEHRQLLREASVYYLEFRRTVSYENQDEQCRHL